MEPIVNMFSKLNKLNISTKDITTRFTFARLHILRASLTVLTSLLICTSSFAEELKPLRIAVASNFSPVLEKLLVEFNANTQIETQLISAASGVLFQQIIHGAPFDIFLSADSEKPQQLNDKQFIIENSQQTYAYGQLAFWSSVNDLTSLDESTFLSLQTTTANTRLAIANPDIAPYGKAAKEALISLGLWDYYKNKLITGNNISQTFQQIRSKSVSLGIVANSQLKLNNLSGIVIPQKHYQLIKQQLVILKNSKQLTNARKFSQFLLSNTTQQKLLEWGYLSNLPVTNAAKTPIRDK